MIYKRESKQCKNSFFARHFFIHFQCDSGRKIVAVNFLILNPNFIAILSKNHNVQRKLKLWQRFCNQLHGRSGQLWLASLLYPGSHFKPLSLSLYVPFFYLSFKLSLRLHHARRRTYLESLISFTIYTFIHIWKICNIFSICSYRLPPCLIECLRHFFFEQKFNNFTWFECNIWMCVWVWVRLKLILTLWMHSLFNTRQFLII